jgi:hypothetical protein
MWTSEKRMQDPNVYSDPAVYASWRGSKKELMPVVEAYRKY